MFGVSRSNREMSVSKYRFADPTTLVNFSGVESVLFAVGNQKWGPVKEAPAYKERDPKFNDMSKFAYLQTIGSKGGSSPITISIKIVEGSVHATQFVEWRLRTDRQRRGPGAFSSPPSSDSRSATSPARWLVRAKEAQLRPPVREIARQQWEKLKVTKRIRASGQPRLQQDKVLELFWQDHFRHEDLLELWKLADSAIYAHGPVGQEARQRVRALGVAFNRRGGGGETGLEVMQLYHHAMRLFTLFEYSSVRDVNPQDLGKYPDQWTLLD